MLEAKGMEKTQQEILVTLRKQEAALLAVLDTVRQAIRAIQPGDGGYWIKFQPVGTDAESQWVSKVLAEIGPQFTSVEAFEKARKIKPKLQRTAIQRALNRLIYTGAVKKIQDGRGPRPELYEKCIYNWTGNGLPEAQ